MILNSFSQLLRVPSEADYGDQELVLTVLKRLVDLSGSMQGEINGLHGRTRLSTAGAKLQGLQGGQFESLYASLNRLEARLELRSAGRRREKLMKVCLDVRRRAFHSMLSWPHSLLRNIIPWEQDAVTTLQSSWPLFCEVLRAPVSLWAFAGCSDISNEILCRLLHHASSRAFRVQRLLTADLANSATGGSKGARKLLEGLTPVFGTQVDASARVVQAASETSRRRPASANRCPVLGQVKHFHRPSCVFLLMPMRTQRRQT